MSFTATLSPDVPGIGTLLSPNVPYPLNIQYPGQRGLMSFTATANQTVALEVSGITTNPVNGSVELYIYGPGGYPNGNPIVNVITTTGYTANLPNLSAGTYTVFIVAQYAVTATMTVTLASGITGTLTANGSGSQFNTTVPGQNVYLTFSGTAGQNLGLGLTNIVFNPTTGAAAQLYVYNPSGSLLTSNGSCFKATIYNGCGANLSLAQTGTYSVVVDPPNGSVTMSFTATLSPDVPGIGTLLSPNVPYPLNVQYSGQRGLMSFTASANQTVALEVSGITTSPANTNVLLYVYGPGGWPNGTPIASDTTATGYTFNLPNLPAGTYTVFIVPQYAVTATMTVTLASGITGTLTADGSGSQFSTTVPGQNVYMTFSGTAGQNLGLGLTNIVFNPTTGAAASLYVYNPDGSLLTSNGSCYAATIYNGCSASLNLTQTGTYSVVVDPPNGSTTMSFTATLSQDVPGISTLLSPNVPYPLNIQYSGQRGLMSFSAGAGQTVALTVSGITTNPANQIVYLYVYAPGGWPNGSPIASTSTTTGYTFHLTNLPAGTYTVFIAPNHAATATMTVTLVPQ